MSYSLQFSNRCELLFFEDNPTPNEGVLRYTVDLAGVRTQKECNLGGYVLSIYDVNDELGEIKQLRPNGTETSKNRTGILFATEEQRDAALDRLGALIEYCTQLN